jgi:hypothetical protein
MSPGRRRSVTRTSNAVTPPPTGFHSIVPQSGLVWHLNDKEIFFSKNYKDLILIRQQLKKKGEMRFASRRWRSCGHLSSLEAGLC